MNEPKWLEWIRKLPTSAIATITFITAIASFVLLFRDDVDIVAVVLTTSTILALWLVCVYASFARTQPLILGGRGVYRFERLRPITLVGAILIPVLTGVMLSTSVTQSVIRIAFLGTPEPSPSPTGVIFAGGAAVPVTPAPPPSSSGRIAYEDYAWLDNPSWPVTVGGLSDVIIAGENLGRAPWIAIVVQMINPSSEAQIISEASLQVEAYEPIGTSSKYTLAVKSTLIPTFLVPKDCPTSSTPSPFGARSFEQSDEAHLIGILPPSAWDTTGMRDGATKPAIVNIPPKGIGRYLLFISANATGKYKFSVIFGLTATNRVTSTARFGPYQYVFLDAATALTLPMKDMESRCPSISK